MSLDALAASATSRMPPDAAQLAAALATLGPRWSIAGKDLRLDLPAPPPGGMTRTGAVAAHAGALADSLDHHPRIELEYPALVLTIHTHDKQALTVLDLVYAARLEQWLRATE